MALSIQCRWTNDLYGFSLKSQRFRYTRWMRTTNSSSSGEPTERKVRDVAWDSVEATELFDHSEDPDENLDISSHKLYANVLAKFEVILKNRLGL